jgi:uncharacterized protein (DUF1330 family)
VAPNPNLTIRYAQVDEAYEAVLGTTAPDDDGPVWMVNLMKYRPIAEYADGRETTLTGQEADDRYAPIDELAAVGAEIVFFATVDTQLLGEAPTWDRVAVVKYPTRRAFVAMSNSPAFEAAHVHKDAGMAQTIVIGGQPMPAPVLPDDAPDWADVPHPPTAEDPYVHVLHVLHFHEGGAEGDMASYQDAAGRVAVPHGVRIGAWFRAEGTILGDGRVWDQVRFNVFPSREAFMAVALDPDRLAAQADHREVAIADTYTMILRPIIDRLRESIEAEVRLPTAGTAP